jgi:NADPH:quinone reductase
MRALVFSSFGGPEVLGLADVPVPTLKPGQVLVRVHVAGLNFADIYRRQGHYHLAGTPPWILGYEGAGAIEALGDGVTGCRIGDRVGFADVPYANAEYVAVDVDRLIPLPDAISFETAAAVLLQGLTAQYLVTDSHDVQAGETVLVHAAGGGVGLLLCQLAAQRGASVIGLASNADKRAAASAAGAKWVFGYDNWTEEVRAAVGPVDVVYDSVGSTLGDSLALARTGGHIVFYGMAGGDPVPVDPRILMDRSLSLTGGDLWNILTSAAIRQQRATMLFDAIMSGAVSVKIAARFPLSDGAEAHRLLQGRTVIGKVLLIIS